MTLQHLGCGLGGGRGGLGLGLGLGGGGRGGELVKRTKSIDQSKDSNNNTIVKTRICSRF